MATIYGIQCVVNGWTYVGCTSCKLAKRMREHRCLLNKRQHASPKMTGDWHEFGRDKFITLELETLAGDCTVEVKRDAEKRWMAHFQNLGALYNPNLQSFGPEPEKARLRIAAYNAKPRNPHSAEHKEKIRLGNLGKHGGPNPKVSATKKALGQKPNAACYAAGAARRQRLKELKI